MDRVAGNGSHTPNPTDPTILQGITVLQESLRAACFRLMRPLARVLLRQGVTAHEFSTIADAAFVRAAEDVLREQHQDPSYSRISTITGIHRHAVSTLSGIAGQDSVGEFHSKDYQRNRIARVLTGWYESPEFTDDEGKPLVLPTEEPAPSFAELVRRYSGDIYPKIILDELLRVKAVRMTRDGRVRVMSRRYTLGGADPVALERLGETAQQLLSTLEFNLGAPEEKQFFHDSAVALHVAPEAVAMIRQLIARRGAIFLDDVEGALGQHELPAKALESGRPHVRAGVTLHLWVTPSPIESRVEDLAASTTEAAPAARRERA